MKRKYIFSLVSVLFTASISICIMMYAENKLATQQKQQQIAFEEQKKEQDEKNEKKKIEEKKKKEELKRQEELNAKTLKTSTSFEYKSDKLSINIEAITKTEPNLKMWIANIKVSDPNQLKTASANDEMDSTSSITKEHSGILGINVSEFAADNKKPGVIQGGKLVRSGTPAKPLCIDKEGNLFCPETNTSYQDLLAQGVNNSFSFGPILVEDGKSLVKSIHNDQKGYKCAIGQKGKGEYIVIIVDGRSPSYSEGITYSQLADEFIKRGCTFAYNLDNSNSATLYFNGKVLNLSPNAKEKTVYNIIYFTKK